MEQILLIHQGSLVKVGFPDNKATFSAGATVFKSDYVGVVEACPNLSENRNLNGIAA